MISFDGVIIGAGAAGLVAALRAAKSGAKIALLDQARGDNSNLVVSGGLVAGAGTRFQAAAGITDSPALFAEDIERKTGGAVDPAIVRAITTRSADAVHFLADGVGLDMHLAVGLKIPGHSAVRLHATPTESGDELAALLRQAARDTPGLMFVPDTEASGLIVEEGHVVGVTTRTGGDFRGTNILLANGGFAGNREMVQKFASEMAGAVNIGRGPNDGRAMAWAVELGADLLFMDSYQGQGHVTFDGKGRLGPGLTSMGAIVLNAEGRRFSDESMGPSEFGAFVLAQPGGWAVEVFDAAMHAAALRLGSYRDSVDRGNVLAAATDAELADQFGLPPETLSRTIADYNLAVAADAPDAFGRTIARKMIVPPYMAAKTTGALAHTQGGLRVDGAARVLRADGTAIPGLLAAGGAAASVSGHGAAGYIPGNGLAQAFALGLIAGETIAQQSGVFAP
jgi:fumarate reductase flavoprotein subunit